MTEPKKIHRYRCEADSDIIITSFGKLRFKSGEFYYAHNLRLPDNTIDKTSTAIAGKFIDAKGEIIDKKIFATKTDCSKYLIYTP